MRTTICALIAAAALGTGMPAMAATERNGYQEIMRGDYAAAERIIAEERRASANDADLMLNLATVYLHTNRHSQARGLYQAILSHADEDLDMGGARYISAHALANAALRRLDQLQLTAR